jgi:segregation and condensation protein B
MGMESLDLQEIRSAMEGILFASGEPVNIDRICLALELDKATAQQVLQDWILGKLFLLSDPV